MTFAEIIFIVVAAITLGGAIMVVTTRNLIHAAMWLILSLFGIAIIYALLSAPFFSVIQVIIYIGAISILMIFAIMLTRRVIQDAGTSVNRGWWLGGLLALLLFTGLVWMLSTWEGFRTVQPILLTGGDTIAELGSALVSPNGYLIPFEVASVLLLAALIGAVVIAWEKRA